MPRISELDAAVSVGPADLVVVVQGGTTKRAAVSLLPSGAAPTGTGFTHVTAGVQDAAAKLVENADVHASAAIAGSKVSPDFGAQAVVTTGSVTAGSFVTSAGYVSVGASNVATVGVVRLNHSAGRVMLAFRNAANTADIHALVQDAELLYIGTDTTYTNANQANIRMYGRSYIYIGYGSTNAAYVDSNGFQTSGNTSLTSFSPSYGGGSGVVFVGNVGTAPGSNPVGGGILYADAGAGKWRGSSGTVTTFAPADPHCPTCGRDFALEHRNETLGEHLAICLPCMLDTMRGAGMATPFVISEKRAASRAQWEAAHAAAKARDAAAAVEAAAKAAAMQPRRST